MLASLGVNCVRLPVNQRHFEREAGVRAAGARRVACCGAAGIYSVIDLHAVPGCQNQHWHSDNPTHVAAFWLHPHFQDQVVQLWEALAERFGGEPVGGGLQPAQRAGRPDAARSSGRSTTGWWRRSARSIPTTSCSSTATRTRPTSPRSASRTRTRSTPATTTRVDGMAFGGPVQRASRSRCEAKFLERTRYMRETGTPIWVGEFGPVYTGDRARRRATSCSPTSSRSTSATAPAGRCGPTRTSGCRASSTPRRTAPCMRHFGEFVAKKARLGVDSWGSTDRELPEVIEPLHALIAREFPAWSPYPWSARRDDRRPRAPHPVRAGDAAGVRDAVPRALGDDDLEALADSFSLANCVRRERLCEIMRDACATSSRAAR